MLQCGMLTQLHQNEWLAQRRGLAKTEAPSIG
jgi:hypothetical protein